MAKTTTRCYWFDDSGKPRRRLSGQAGCSRSHTNCTYVHPNEPEWEMLPPVRYVPPECRPNSSEIGRVRKPSTSIIRPTSPGRHTPPREPRAHAETPRPPPLAARIAPAREYQREPRLSSSVYSPTTPVTPMDPSDLTRRPRVPSTSSKAAAVEPTQRRDSNASVTSSLTQAPRRSTSISMPPPPAVKPAISLANGNGNGALHSQSPAAKEEERKPPELTAEARRETWVNRIKAMSSAVKARLEFLDLKHETEKLDQLLNLPRHQHFSDEARAPLRRKLAERVQLREAKKEELNTLLSDLINSEFWPILPRQLISPEDRFREVRADLQGLKGHMQEVDNALYVIRSRVDAIPPPSYPNPEHDPSRPLKRRRLSNDSALPMDPPPPIAPDAVMRPLLDDTLKRFQDLEEKVIDLEHAMVQHDSEFDGDLDGRIIARMEELGIGSSSRYQPDPGEGEASGSASADRLPHDVEKELSVQGDQIFELATNLAQQIEQSNSHEKTIAQIESARDGDRLELNNLRIWKEEMIQARARDEAEIRALTAAVKALMSRKDEPPPPPVPSTETILDAITPAIIDTVRRDVHTLLDDLHASVNHLIETQNKDMYSHVTGKLELTLSTVQAIWNWMDKIKQGESSADNTVPFTFPSAQIQPPNSGTQSI